MTGDASFTREEADNYARVIARDGDLRVIVCRADHQWIVQRRRGGRWRACGFFRTSLALRRVWATEGSSPLPEIEALPQNFSAYKRGQGGVGGFCGSR